MDKIKVLIIDDSSVIRNVIREVLTQDEHIDVVGEAKDPIVARDLIKKLNPDVLTLDVEMPKMDGITFLSNLMRLRPMPVIMLSTLTTKGADTTLQALELGAIDFIAKPSFKDLLENKNAFKNLLIDKIKNAANVDQKNYKLSVAVAGIDSARTIHFTGCSRNNHLVAIGASTGGTEAIKDILLLLPSNSPPIVITQHIPAIFSERFAKRMNNLCAVMVHEAKHGQKIKDGNVYISPGDKHLTVTVKAGNLFCTLVDSAPVNRHKPSVDVLFGSLEPIASNVQAILLTGMGQDGAKEMLMLKNNGARTIIQDKKSSLIWGMPGSAFQLNAHTEQSSLNNIAQKILTYATLTREGMEKVINN